MKLGALHNSRVFVSYHRADTEADAGRLVDTLRRHLGDESVFVDVSGVQPGSNWERVVDHALTKSVVLLLVVGPLWKATESILYELDRAPANDGGRPRVRSDRVSGARACDRCWFTPLISVSVSMTR